MQFEAEWHAVPSGLLCCLAGIYTMCIELSQKQMLMSVFQDEKTVDMIMPKMEKYQAKS